MKTKHLARTLSPAPERLRSVPAIVSGSSFMGICLEEASDSNEGRALVSWESRGELFELRASSLRGVSIRQGDRVLLTRLENSDELIIVGALVPQTANSFRNSPVLPADGGVAPPRHADKHDSSSRLALGADPSPNGGTNFGSAVLAPASPDAAGESPGERTVVLPPGERLSIRTPSGQELASLDATATVPRILLRTELAIWECTDALNIIAPSIALRATRGEVVVSSPEDIIVKGKTIRLN